MFFATVGASSLIGAEILKEASKEAEKEGDIGDAMLNRGCAKICTVVGYIGIVKALWK